MKKIFSIAAALLCCVFLLAGCPEQTFDDIAYKISEAGAGGLIQDINSSRIRTASLNAEFETTDVTETSAGTTKVVINQKFGRISGTPFTQKTTATTQNGQAVSTEIITYYSGKIYQTSEGVTIQVGTYTVLNTLNFFDSFITQLTENDLSKIQKIEEKKFKETNYYRFHMKIRQINNENPQAATEYITSYNLEYGINSSGYIEMFRINYIIKTNAPSGAETNNNADYWETSSVRKCTTLLLNMGDKVQFTPPTLT